MTTHLRRDPPGVRVSTATRRALYGAMTSDGTLRNLLAAPAPGYSNGIYYQSAPDTAAS